MMDRNLSPRGRAALGLVIAEAFLGYRDVGGDDQRLAKEGVALAWQWVEGRAVDPYRICDFIDGETNLPIRSTVYEKGSRARDIMASAFHAIGITAAYACEETGKRATESVENFGENELTLLYQRIGKLDPDDRAKVARAENYLISAAGAEESSGFGRAILRSDVISSFRR